MPFRRDFILAYGLAIVSAAPAGAQPAAEDAVSRLERRLERGEATLDFRAGSGGYLASLLKQLGVNIDSQVLVFSKTSLQQDRISPQTPRAVYFNDNVAVGSVPGGEIIELTSLDPIWGVVFHTLDVHDSAQPRFKRKVEECTKCHGPVNPFSPGLMVASVYPASDGTPVYLGGPSLFNTTDHRTPFENRWGGWYVTGTHGSQHHLGNAVARDQSHPLDLEESGTQNRRTLADKLDVSRYLAPSSDIVALMTLEHQTRMTNLITSIAAKARAPHSPKNAATLAAAVEELVEYMVFADEAPLSAPIEGVSTFTKTFPQAGPRDRQGRSLRDFDLKRRLFRYPVSYMIYSESFDALPDAVRQPVLRRIFDRLTGENDGESRAAFEILRDTKPNLPDYWKDVKLSSNL
jgi:hypothetical protein